MARLRNGRSLDSSMIRQPTGSLRPILTRNTWSEARHSRVHSEGLNSLKPNQDLTLKMLRRSLEYVQVIVASIWTLISKEMHDIMHGVGD